DAATNPRFHALLKAFGRRTGVPVLVNTSFNVRGEPIVCTPRDAIEAFFSTPLDALVIGSFLVEKGGAA
ncbi:MAG: carbamoyltransferase, partial [Methylibium sp.]|nr:carbamoyltransferase [Methylibium sp.]